MYVFAHNTMITIFKLLMYSVIGSLVTITGLYMFLWGKNKETESSTALSSRMDNEAQNINKDNDSKSPV